jgi:hypothetical protein
MIALMIVQWMWTAPFMGGGFDSGSGGVSVGLLFKKKYPVDQVGCVAVNV